jgi:ABC-2 type transport system ATP-binding protein
LRDYADRGGTVLLSSHLIHEIEAIADDLVVIGNGQIVAQGTKADLLEQSGVLIRAANRLIVACALAEADISTTPVGEDGLLAQGDMEQIGRIVFAAGIPVTELRPADGGGLEAMFLELTAETQRESTTSRQSVPTADRRSPP